MFHVKRDIPIIYSGPMVRALIENRKTMTRRLAWRPSGKSMGVPGVTDKAKASPWQYVKPGDRLWVRENFAPRLDEEKPNPHYAKYRADNGHGQTPCDPMDFHSYPRKWTPSIHMPRWASRLTLIVESTKIERLQDISESDAMDEGAGPILVPPDGGGAPHVEGFIHLWQSLHGPGSWDDNPWVVAIRFRVIKANVDQLKEAA